jgi:hypothetical protein
MSLCISNYDKTIVDPIQMRTNVAIVHLSHLLENWMFERF